MESYDTIEQEIKDKIIGLEKKMKNISQEVRIFLEFCFKNSLQIFSLTAHHYQDGMQHKIQQHSIEHWMELTHTCLQYLLSLLPKDIEEFTTRHFKTKKEPWEQKKRSFELLAEMQEKIQEEIHIQLKAV